MVLLYGRMVEWYGGFEWWYFMVQLHDGLTNFLWWLLTYKTPSNKTVEDA
jgi:hypothetical protein